MKICSKCKKEKTLSHFHHDKYKKSGLKPSCDSCCSDAEVKYFIRTNPNYKKPKEIKKEKLCKYCNTIKKISEFYPRKSNCKKCTYKQNKEYLDENPDKLKQYRETQNKTRKKEQYKIKHKEYKEKNSERLRVSHMKSQAKYYLNHPDKLAETKLGFLASKILGPLVLERDNYKCKLCGSKAQVFHHIKPKAKFPELVLEIRNLISLCKDCHAKAHNNSRWATIDEDIAKQLTLIIEEKYKETENANLPNL